MLNARCVGFLLFLLLFGQECKSGLIYAACRTLTGPAVPSPDALRVHMAVGVVLDGAHWHCDVGYGGKGLRLPIRNDLVQTSQDGKFATGLAGLTVCFLLLLRHMS